MTITSGTVPTGLPEGPSGRGGPPSRTSTAVKVIRVALVLALIPAGIYLYPRVVGLVMTPTNLNRSVAYAEKYNPNLLAVRDHEARTLAVFDALDQMNAALVRVRATDAEVASQLRTLIAQIRGDVQSVLDDTNGEVARLLTALDRLKGEIDGLNGPVDDTDSIVGSDRRKLADILREASSVASDVHNARDSASSAADNVAGPDD